MGISELIRDWLKEHETAAGLNERLKLEQERRELEKTRYKQQLAELQSKIDSLLELLNQANNQLGIEKKQNSRLKDQQQQQEALTQTLKQELEELRQSTKHKTPKRSTNWKTV